MLVQKNNLNQQQIQNLKPLINKFIIESGCQLNREAVLQATLQNIVLGLERKAAHDTWIIGDMQGYCLGRVEKDADGQLVYTAYQLWLDPILRDGEFVRDFVWYLKSKAREDGYVRLYVVSSRLDKIKAYARGLGRDFKVQTVTFVSQLQGEENVKPN